MEAGFSSDRKREKFAVGAHVPVNTQNGVISRCCFAEFCYARAEPMKAYYVLVAVAVAVAVVAC